MKEKNIEELKNEIRNYFFTIYRFEHISSQETEICIKNYCDYLFLKKDIYTNDKQIVIRKVKSNLLEPSETAKMSIDGNRFEILLKKDSYSIKDISKIEVILSLMVSLGHEVQHIIQYIKAFKMMNKYDEHILNLINLANEHDKKCSPRKNKKLVTKLTNLYAHNVTISSVEQNAILRSFENLKILLEDLISSEYNKSFKNFLSLLLVQLKYIKRDTYKYNKIAQSQAEKNVLRIKADYEINSKEIYVF